MMFNVDKFGNQRNFFSGGFADLSNDENFLWILWDGKAFGNRTFPFLSQTFVCDCFWLVSCATEVVKSRSVRWLLVNIRTTESYIAPVSSGVDLPQNVLLSDWRGRSSLVINKESSIDTPAATLEIKLWAHKTSERDSIYDFKWLHELSMTISMAGIRSFVHKLRNNRFNRLNFHASWA